MYTYSFLINRPVIFYSKYEKKLNNLNYYNLNFFRDREKIGVIVDDVNNLLNVLKRKKIFIKIKNEQKKLKNEFKIGFTKKRFNNFLMKFL